MSKIDDFVVNPSLIDSLRERITNASRASSTLEQASQEFIKITYEAFSDSLILARLFATATYEELPPKNKQFVDELSKKANIASKINKNTLVLSLLGTCGQERHWNNKNESKGHIGIPLASGDFIESIPMMSRLLKELGMGLSWIDKADTKMVTQTLGLLAGVFHVEDAKTAVDNMGRKIIAEQGFVLSYGVKTVFGLGGGYAGYPRFITAIFFTKDDIPKNVADRFMDLIITFKVNTIRHILNKTIFS